MSILDDTIRVHPTLYVAIEAMMSGEHPVHTIADSKHTGGMFWMGHRFVPDETLGRDEIRRGEDVPEWHVQELQDAMAEYAQKALHEREGATLAARAKCSICGGTDGISAEFRPGLDSVVLCWTCSSVHAVAKSFRSRVAGLLKRVEWSGCCGLVLDAPDGVEAAKEELAALLKECEA